MHLTWKDGMATAFVGAGVALYGLSLAGTTVAGLTGNRSLVVAVFALGVAACYTAKAQIWQVYGAGGGQRSPMPYVVTISTLGGITLVAGIVAFVSGGAAALATMVAATFAMWALATVRHARARGPRRGLQADADLGLGQHAGRGVRDREIDAHGSRG
ncbi:hypothetical protein [Pengzhenrongella frigida]|uniref:Uncharacterized protein n=1 Tax=Pengzhenrongella frigida TaxID=1259133 RepID=A0A4Q5N393_9MICO|nr:hypothetical protein [Cellulomonas sp. HLT2-17]RYV51077.1 hypothetical protein EUA98_10560 [Cellulomonas sp. HLT2-17]